MGVCFLLKPVNNFETTYEEFEVETLKLKEMYDKIGCRMIDIKRTVVADVGIVFDDEYWLKEEVPCVNMFASRLYGDIICGNVIVAKVKGAELVGFTDMQLEITRRLIKKYTKQ